MYFCTCQIPDPQSKSSGEGWSLQVRYQYNTTIRAVPEAEWPPLAARCERHISISARIAESIMPWIPYA